MYVMELMKLGIEHALLRTLAQEPCRSLMEGPIRLQRDGVIFEVCASGVRVR
jgi:hypothetical protein